ncbi:hypothetical protein C8Q70DRAFT_145898 [Cubamyces menziesii]|nr:hypothetical protein C8Q70DRAFT_145898 [Cubamyces menziesii]
MECSAMNTNGTYQAPALRHRRPELPSKPCTARASNPNRDIFTGTRPIASGSMFITPPWAQHGRSGADDGGGQNIHPRTDPGSPASHPAQSLNLNSFLPARPSPPRTQNSVCNPDAHASGLGSHSYRAFHYASTPHNAADLPAPNSCLLTTPPPHLAHTTHIPERGFYGQGKLERNAIHTAGASWTSASPARNREGRSWKAGRTANWQHSNLADAMHWFSKQASSRQRRGRDAPRRFKLPSKAKVTRA